MLYELCAVEMQSHLQCVCTLSSIHISLWRAFLWFGLMQLIQRDQILYLLNGSLWDLAPAISLWLSHGIMRHEMSFYKCKSTYYLYNAVS